MSDHPTTARAATVANKGTVAQLDAALESAGIFLSVEASDRELTLTGEVDSPEIREAALDLAGAFTSRHGLIVIDNIEVLTIAPEDAWELGDEDDVTGGDAVLAPDSVSEAASLQLDPDFTGDVGTTDSAESAAEAEPYFPPTDPVVAPATDDQELQVIGGFGATSMDDDESERSSSVPRDDEDIAGDILRELREDAATTDLLVHVTVRRGTAVLRGNVDSLEDAESAEAVAARVQGVMEVREELSVIELQRNPRPTEP